MADLNEMSVKRRRWWRYSLRTMLVVVTLLCVWLGIVSKWAIDQRRIVAVIKETGGIVEYDYDEDDPFGEAATPNWLEEPIGVDYFHTVTLVQIPAMSGPERGRASTGSAIDGNIELIGKLPALRYLFLQDYSVRDHEVRVLGRLTHLVELHLDVSDVSDSGLEHLRDLKQLTKLSLRSSGRESAIADAGLAHLNGLRKLDYLDVGGTQVTGTGLAYLSGAPLKQIELDGTPFNDAGLRTLQILPKLESLTLSETQVTDAGLPLLRALPKLAELSLNNTNVTGSGLEGLKTLETLCLTHTRITDEQMAYIARMPKLRSLDLTSAQVTDAIGPIIKTMNLRSLHLTNTRVSESTSNELRASGDGPSAVYSDAAPR